MRKYALLPVLIAACGCAKTPDPVSGINDSIQQDTQQLIDYANNNMNLDADKQLLLQGVKDCAARADAMNTAHEASIQACEATGNKLAAERNALAVILVLLVAIRLFNIRI